jgi:hypothetical protein
MTGWGDPGVERRSVSPLTVRVQFPTGQRSLTADGADDPVASRYVPNGGIQAQHLDGSRRGSAERSVAELALEVLTHAEDISIH